MILYTIGFTQKRAENFFEILRINGVQRLVDIRLNPGGQLSGFAKKEDLPYFLNRLANRCDYVHMLELAPTKEILEAYRKDGNWGRYQVRFEKLMEDRNIPVILDRALFENQINCLLCSEATPEHCHRRLVAERLALHWANMEIVHL